MIEVRNSSIHGRGAFTTAAIRKGETFHTAHLLVFDGDQAEAVAKTVAAHYVFYIADHPTNPTLDVTGLAMSPISFVNHTPQCNADFVVDPAASTVSFTARRDIAAGEEVTIDYGDFAAKLGIE
jgi:hypothetical protein